VNITDTNISSILRDLFRDSEGQEEGTGGLYSRLNRKPQQLHAKTSQVERNRCDMKGNL